MEKSGDPRSEGSGGPWSGESGQVIHGHWGGGVRSKVNPSSSPGGIGTGGCGRYWLVMLMGCCLILDFGIILCCACS